MQVFFAIIFTKNSNFFSPFSAPLRAFFYKAFKKYLGSLPGISGRLRRINSVGVAELLAGCVTV
jgi:hypothetical protein